MCDYSLPFVSIKQPWAVLLSVGCQVVQYSLIFSRKQHSLMKRFIEDKLCVFITLYTYEYIYIQIYILMSLWKLAVIVLTS
jgi:hypothetical protein